MKGPRMADDEKSLLVHAVSKLTVAVERLDTLLREEYPKRTEVEKKFVTKLQNQKVVVRLILVALIAVLGCYVFTIGSYSQCLVGDESPSICEFVPGYQERIDRRDEIDNEFKHLRQQIKQLRKEAEPR
jgi:cytochrome c-type biogenesis protein CcmH/NrfG